MNRCGWISRVPSQGPSPWLPVALSGDDLATPNDVSDGTNREMFFTITRETRSIEAVGRLHRHKELLLSSTCRVERKKARRLATLDACAFPYVAHRALLSKRL